MRSDQIQQALETSRAAVSRASEVSRSAEAVRATTAELIAQARKVRAEAQRLGEGSAPAGRRSD